MNLFKKGMFVIAFVFAFMLFDITSVSAFTISFDANGGTGTKESVTIDQASHYTLPECDFTAPDGKMFDGWRSSTMGNPEKAGYQLWVFEDTTLKAIWKDIEYYDINTNIPENGAIIVQDKAAADETVEVDIQPDKGYKLKSITALSGITLDNLKKAVGDSEFIHDWGSSKIDKFKVDRDEVRFFTTVGGIYRPVYITYDNDSQKYKLTFSDNSVAYINLDDNNKITSFVYYGNEYKKADGSVSDNALVPDEIKLNGTGNTRTFTMPAVEVSLSAEFEEAPITPGEVEKIDTKDNANNATLDNTTAELKKLITLSDEEEIAVANGKNLYIFVEVDDISDLVSTTDKKLVEGKLDTNSKVGMYLDINLFKQIEGQTKTKIEESNGKVKISFEIPESLRNSNREFYIIRIHNGVATKITPTVKDNILTFETDKFSTYALAYTDSTVKDNASNPKTSDNIMFYIAMLGLSIIGLAGEGLYKKRFN